MLPNTKTLRQLSTRYVPPPLLPKNELKWFATPIASFSMLPSCAPLLHHPQTDVGFRWYTNSICQFFWNVLKMPKREKEKKNKETQQPSIPCRTPPRAPSVRAGWKMLLPLPSLCSTPSLLTMADLFCTWTMNTSHLFFTNREQQYLLNMSSFSALLCVLPLRSRDKSTQTIIRISFVPNINTFLLFFAVTVTDFFPCVFNFLYQFSALDNF